MTWLRTLALLVALAPCAAPAQTAPSASEIARYSPLMLAAWSGDAAAVLDALAQGADLGERDGNGRTAIHVAAFASNDDALQALAQAGADMNALDHQRYDAVTIAAVANDPDLLQLAIDLGNRADLITSPYDGTALIAAAHLGHYKVVDILIRAGAPLDHVNNLGWTALIEAVVLGDGGPAHQKTLRLLLDAGADRTIPDTQGRTPLDLAHANGFPAMVRMLSD